jgi:hypothetical protein
MRGGVASFSPGVHRSDWVREGGRGVPPRRKGSGIDMDARPTSPKTLRRSLAAASPPAGIPPAVEALWWAGKGEWDKAHALVQDDPGADAAWVHALLHRQEGDDGNAAYWYRRAGRPAATGYLAAEWDAIAAALLGRG